MKQNFSKPAKIHELIFTEQEPRKPRAQVVYPNGYTASVLDCGGDYEIGILKNGLLDYSAIPSGNGMGVHIGLSIKETEVLLEQIFNLLVTPC